MTAAWPRFFLGHVFSVLLFCFSLFWFSDTVVDPDIWGHVRFGQDILRTRSIIQTDTYSYRTGGQTWINHEWLAEVIFAALYDQCGPIGLGIFKVIVSLLIVGFCHSHLRHRGLGEGAAALLLFLIVIPFRLGLGTVRPQVFTYFLFLVELLVLERSTATRSRWVWVLPALMAIWINLHGGVLAGVGVLGIWLVGRLVASPSDNRGQPWRRSENVRLVAILALASGLALLINPYGATLLTFLLRTATVPRPEISEWTPLRPMSLPGMIDFALLAIGLIALTCSRRRRDPSAIVVLSGTALLPLISNRHYPLFAFALVVLAGEHIGDVTNRWWRQRRARPALFVWAAAAGYLISLLLIVLPLPALGCIRITPFYFGYPARAVALLAKSGVTGNMAVPFDWGEFVLWQLGPGVKVSIDGRRETVYSDESYRQSLDFARGNANWAAMLDGNATDLVMLPIGSPTTTLLGTTAGWVPLYKDTYCVIFAREEFPGITQIVGTPIPQLPDDGRDLCFPGPDSVERRRDR